MTEERREELLRQAEDAIEGLRRWMYDERRDRAGYRDREEAQRHANAVDDAIQALRDDR